MSRSLIARFLWSFSAYSASFGDRIAQKKCQDWPRRSEASFFCESGELDAPGTPTHAGIPYLDCCVGTAADDALAVWAQRHAGDSAGVTFEGLDFVARACVPHLDCRVMMAANDALAIATQGHAADTAELAGAALEGHDLLACGRVPDLDR